MLKINNSTAKAILRKFKDNGHVFVRKSERNDQEGSREDLNNDIEEGP